MEGCVVARLEVMCSYLPGGTEQNVTKLRADSVGICTPVPLRLIIHIQHPVRIKNPEAPHYGVAFILWLKAVRSPASDFGCSVSGPGHTFPFFVLPVHYS